VIKISVNNHKILNKKKDNEIKRASRSIYQKTNGGASQLDVIYTTINHLLPYRSDTNTQQPRKSIPFDHVLRRTWECKHNSARRGSAGA
jgi:hypothetical protein